MFQLTPTQRRRMEAHIHLRIAVEDHKTIKKAAKAAGMTVSDFIRQVAEQAAQQLAA